MREHEKIIALFDSFESPNFSAKNRFLRSATWLAAADEETGAITRAEVGRHSEVAFGGAGTVITGAAYISEEGRALKGQWGLHNDQRIGDVTALAEAVHKAGTKLIVQVCHAGGQRDPEIIKKTETLSPSGLEHPGRSFPTKTVTKDDIAKIKNDFAAAAARAKAGGADGVEIHAGHGFLITQFLSPMINRRTDEYGGSLENRMRLIREILSSVRSAVGERFQVWLKISIAEGTEFGYKAEDGIKTAETLLADGADGIEVSCGTIYAGAQNAPSVIGVSAGESEAPFAQYAAALKKSSSPDKVVILTGGLRSLSVMANLVYDGVCDLLGMSRPFNADPDLINRWAEEDSRPSACLSCNACFNTAVKKMIDCPIIRDRNEGFWDPL